MIPATLASAALGQLSALEPKAPAPLPPPPWFEHHLFESPWLFVALLAGSAFVAHVVLSAKKKPKQARRATVGLVLLALAVWVCAWLVHTPRERADALTRQVVAAVTSGDTRGLDAALASDVAAFGGDSPDARDKSTILTTVGQFFGPGGKYPIQDYGILELQAAQSSAELVQVQLKVRVTPRDSGMPIISWWRLDLRPRGDGMEVSAIRLFSSNFSLSY
jgi:hypothetical protein